MKAFHSWSLRLTSLAIKRPESGIRTMSVRFLPLSVIALGDQVAPDAVIGALLRLSLLTAR